MKRIIEWVVVACILVGLIALLYPAVQNSRNPKGLYGKMIPAGPPGEANRIVYSTGLSIIAPKNWDRILDGSPNTTFLGIAARGAPARRLRALITIQQTTRPADATLSRYRRTVFHGYTAYEKMEVAREDTFDDPAWSVYELYVDASGQWWLVTYGVADAIRTLPAEVKRYIDTITFPERKTT